MKPSKLDILIIIVVLLFALGISLWARRGAPPGERVEIYVNNQLYRTLSLSVADTISFSGARGDMTVSVRDNQVAIDKVDCPRQICRNMGPIQGRGEAMICIPNAVVVKIDGRDDSGLDATTR